MRSLSEFRPEFPSQTEKAAGDGSQLEGPKRATYLPPPSKKDKFRRALWLICWALLYRPVPVPFYRWRCLVLRVFGARIEGGARPYPASKVWAPWNLEMRRNSCIANDVICYNVAKITLSEDSTVSQGAYLCTASHAFRDQNFDLIAAEIVVERSAWIGTQAFLGPGVTVREGGVVGARAVVMRTVPVEAVVAGNPATIISTRRVHSRDSSGDSERLDA